MNLRTSITLALGLTALAATSALAQPTIAWSTIDCGGGSTSGGAFSVEGTIAQHDATPALTGGTFTLTGGFWSDFTFAPPCFADFNQDGNIDFFDYLDFVDAFSSGDMSADFNGDTALDFFDYLDFVDAFSTGC